MRSHAHRVSRSNLSQPSNWGVNQEDENHSEADEQDDRELWAKHLHILKRRPVLARVVRFIMQQVPPPQKEAKADVAIITHKCEKCGQESLIQANLGESHPLQTGHLPFPASNTFKCPGCGTETNLVDARRQIEAQSRKPVVA